MAESMNIVYEMRESVIISLESDLKIAFTNFTRDNYVDVYSKNIMLGTCVYCTHNWLPQIPQFLRYIPTLVFFIETYCPIFI